MNIPCPVMLPGSSSALHRGHVVGNDIRISLVLKVTPGNCSKRRMPDPAPFVQRAERQLGTITSGSA
ncbi:MAG TPA: hypothetical protein PLP26_15230, partial [Ilumatobacteraceae bacterium]|nr:hypothetical protein [Ilumatobacteraceae bacterium]